MKIYIKKWKIQSYEYWEPCVILVCGWSYKYNQYNGQNRNV